MAALTGQSIASSYKDLLQVSNSNSGIDGTARVVSDGEDTASKLYLDTSRVGVGELAPTDGLFHIHEGSAGSVTAHANGDELVLESDNSEVGMTILGSATSNGNILFGSPTDHKRGYITYAHNGDTLILGAQAGNAMKLDVDSKISLSNNDSGDGNTIFGHDAATPDDGGNYNIAIGEETAKALTTGSSGVYIGTYAGTNTNTGNSNVAIGYQALHNNTDKSYNLAIGGGSLYFAQGHYNTGIGYYAGRGTGNYSGTNNISIGYQTAQDISGSRNLSIGDYAGHTGTNDLTSGVNNILIGVESEVSTATASRQIAIGYAEKAYADNTVSISGNILGLNIPNTMPSPHYRLDGTNDYISVADNNAFSFGDGSTDNGFSASAWIYMEDATDFPIFSKGVYNSTGEWFFGTESDDKLKFFIFDESVASTYEGVRFNTTVTSYEHKWIHVCATYNGVGGTSANGGMKIYLNGKQINDTNEGAGTYVAMENLGANFEIGKSDSNYAQGSISTAQVWNRELTATEVKELYSGASVPFKYKGANQTALYTSDFTSGNGSWAAVRTTVDGNIDSIGGQNDTLRVTVDGSSGVDHYARLPGFGMTVGKFFRVKFDYYIPSGNSVVDQIGINSSTGGITYGQFVGTTDSWITTSIDYDVPYNTASQDFPIILSAATGNSSTLSGTSAQNDVFYVKNITITPIGAVAEYDGSGVASDKWLDKSGNDLHGTVTNGATVENAPSSDDGLVYEEGTWTPIFKSGSNVLTIPGTATYKRVGNMVSVFFGAMDVTTEGTTSSTGQFQIQDFPYTAPATKQWVGSLLEYGGAVTFEGEGIPYIVIGSGTIANLMQRDEAQTQQHADITNIGANSYFSFQITYEIA